MSPSPSRLPLEPETSRWFTQEVQPHERVLRSYLRGSFPDVRDIDDLVQESYLRIWKARAAHPIACARGFLFTIARRLALKTAVRQRTAAIEALPDLSSLAVADEQPGPAETLTYQEKVALLASALRHLPPRCREVVVRRKLLGHSQREVAEALGLSERTVENQLARGVMRCARWLRARGFESCFDS